MTATATPADPTAAAVAELEAAALAAMTRAGLSLIAAAKDMAAARSVTTFARKNFPSTAAAAHQLPLSLPLPADREAVFAVLVETLQRMGVFVVPEVRAALEAE